LLSISENDPNVEGLPRAELNDLLGEISPRDAIQNGLIATKLGNKSLYSGLIRLTNKLGSRIVDDHFFDVEKLILIARYLNFHKFVFQTIKSNSLRNTEVLGVERRFLSSPKGMLNHYLFNNDADSEFDVPSIKVFDIPNGIFSIDISLQGRTHFYCFTESGELISDLSSGLDPLLILSVLK